MRGGIIVPGTRRGDRRPSLDTRAGNRQADEHLLQSVRYPAFSDADLVRRTDRATRGAVAHGVSGSASQ
jgi:hypothetical protein